MNVHSTILIVEDDEVNYMLFEEILSKFPYKITRAITGYEAIDQCRENKDIQLVFMDIKLPEMDGLEATRRIRDFDKNIPIVAQTAYAMVTDRHSALEAGCNEYISKPIKVADINAVIRKYLD